MLVLAILIHRPVGPLRTSTPPTVHYWLGWPAPGIYVGRFPGWDKEPGIQEPEAYPELGMPQIYGQASGKAKLGGNN